MSAFAEGFEELDEPAPAAAAPPAPPPSNSEAAGKVGASSGPAASKTQDRSYSVAGLLSSNQGSANGRARDSGQAEPSKAGSVRKVDDDGGLVMTGYKAPTGSQRASQASIATDGGVATTSSSSRAPSQQGGRASNGHSQSLDQYAEHGHHAQPIPLPMQPLAASATASAQSQPVFGQPAQFSGSTFGRIPMVSGTNARLPTPIAPGLPKYGIPAVPAQQKTASSKGFISPPPTGYGAHFNGHYSLPANLSPYPYSTGSPASASTSKGFTSVKPAGKGVIDLTDLDDGTDGSSDDVAIKAEKIPLKAPEEDDELQITGETTSEAMMPVCIGQLSGVALILYPIEELKPPPDLPNMPPGATAPLPPLRVAMLRTQQQNCNGVQNETIKLYAWDSKENFGVVEHRLANVLGPLMTKDNRRGLGIWTEAWVIRTKERSPMMLQLVMLLFCHPHVVHIVSKELERSAIYLQHPLSYDEKLHNGYKYANPHGSILSTQEADRRRQQMLTGMSGGYTRAYSSAAKSVEVQREQVEEMFKSMKSGADLGEVEPDPLVITKMYPHQKQALAFLLDREKWKDAQRIMAPRRNQADDDDEDNMIALWRVKRDLYGKFIGWHNVVTEVEIGHTRPPPQCRGAILADDMGLGKTIVVISLIAATLQEAREYGTQPPTQERDQTVFDAVAAHPNTKKKDQGQTQDLSVAKSGFSTPIYGKAGTAPSIADVIGSNGSGSKKKKKGAEKREKQREEAETSRLEKLVRRSRATLVVCPLSTVVNWEQQLDEHIGIDTSVSNSKKRKGDKSGTSTPTHGLSMYLYHGPSRTNDVEELADHDVIITTYSTLASEYAKQCRKEEQDMESESSSDGGIEETDALGKPLKSKAKKRKRKKIEGECTSPLQQIEFFRVVLDEAHMIKEHTTVAAKAACDLMAQRRICLTGTPLQNSLNDLFSLMRFLRLEPFTDKSIWTTYIGAPAKVGDPLGVSRLRLLMRHLALRRTKQSTDKDGKPILSIPPKKEVIQHLTLTEQEKAFYTSHHRRYKHNFEALQKTDSLLKNYASILQEVLRLRQICAHMALVRDSEDAARAGNGEDTHDVVQSIKAHGLSKGRALRLLALMRDTGAAQCVECNCELVGGGLGAGAEDLEAEDGPKKKRRGRKPTKISDVKEEEQSSDPGLAPVMTRCQHLFCLRCFQKSICSSFPDAVDASDRSTCSVCREEISPVIDAVQVSAKEVEEYGADESDDEESSGPSRGSRSRLKKTKSRIVEHSSKVTYLMEQLIVLSQNNPVSKNYVSQGVDLSAFEEDELYRPLPHTSTKVVVFSQWTKLLDRVEDGLNQCNISFARLDGSMNRAERSKALNTFKSDLACEVLLISLRAGGVGLNLTHASVVYMLEPSWNPSVEQQAVDRIHRLGQTRPVKTIRLIVKDSIEANMLEIQKRKTELANLSLSQTLSKAQLAERRLEDLRTLFK